MRYWAYLSFIFDLLKVQFYSVHQNLDVSRSLHTLRLISPAVKINVLGSHLIIATRDSTLTLYKMKLSYNSDKSMNRWIGLMDV